MTQFEYKVLPAPQRGQKAKGAKTTEARFAHALMEVMNELGAEGWEYLRADTLPCEERVGLTGRTTRFQNMLIFRRALKSEDVQHGDAQTAAALSERKVNKTQELRAIAARRLAETLTAKPLEGAPPEVYAVPPQGSAPKVGSAVQAKDPDIAAE